MYRGCKIYKVPDHRGRTQWWVTIPREQGALRHICNSFDDGKRIVDAHLAREQSEANDYTIIFAFALLLAMLAAAFLAN